MKMRAKARCDVKNDRIESAKVKYFGVSFPEMKISFEISFQNLHNASCLHTRTKGA